jgi:hypothetical protein
MVGMAPKKNIFLGEHFAYPTTEQSIFPLVQ